MTNQLTQAIEMIDVQLAADTTPELVKQALLKSKTAIVRDHIRNLNGQLREARKLLPKKVKAEVVNAPKAAEKKATKKA